MSFTRAVVFGFISRRTLPVILSMLLAFSMISGSAHAVDKVVTNAIIHDKDKRENYPALLLAEALQHTVDDFGEFEIVPYGPLLQRKRALVELGRGRLDVYSSATQPQWEENTLPIYIPLRKGILGYRLFLIRKDRQEEFSQINTLKDLRKLRFGSGSQWSITKAFKSLGFKVAGIVGYEQLFASLNHRRFDLFPRGVNEIFHEYDGKHAQYPDMVIEANLALYIPLPTYFFVSPKNPRLRSRIEMGLQRMIKNGRFDALFKEFHKENLARAHLSNRRIFRVENPSLSKQNPIGTENLWYQLSE